MNKINFSLIGLLLLAVYLVLIGGVYYFSWALDSYVLPTLALAAGVCIILGWLLPAAKASRARNQAPKQPE